MAKHLFTLEYWKDDDWYVGRLREVPGVFTQGETLEELQENVREAYELMLADSPSDEHSDAQVMEVEIEV